MSDRSDAVADRALDRLFAWLLAPLEDDAEAEGEKPVSLHPPEPIRPAHDESNAA